MTNLGEAFIDIGAMELLKQAAADCPIIFITPMSHYYNQSLQKRTGKKLFLNDNPLKNAANLGLYINVDILVMSGMFATEEFVRYGSATYWLGDFLKMHKNIATLFMGVGGDYYTETESITFSSYVKKNMNVISFISRDHGTYDLYKDKFTNSCCRIDCAFFVSDAYNPEGFSNKDYIVSSFNTITEPKELELSKEEIIRPQHMFYSATYNHKAKNIFISDSPLDYLSLYANAKETHTDLVHATIVSLVYGKKVKYYGNSLRSGAFDAAGVLKDNNGYLYLPRETLELRKKQMKDTVTQILEGYAEMNRKQN